MDQNAAAVAEAVTWEEALSAWFTGDFDACIDRCRWLERGGRESRDVAFLRSRSLLRLDRAAEAMDVLDRIEPEPLPSDLEVTRRLLIGAALTRLGRSKAALERFREIREITRNSHSIIQSEIALNVGLAHYATRQLDLADAALDEVRADADILHVCALEHKAWVACARGNYRDAVSLFIEALDRLDRCDHCDRLLEANCMQALAQLAVDGLDRRAWQAVATRRADFQWNASGLAFPHFRVALSAAIFENDVEGRATVAVVEARRAYEIAPTQAYKVQALCKRASIARCVGERVAQHDHVQAAVEAFGGLDPDSLSGDERSVLLSLAEELANAGRPAEARSIFEAFRDSKRVRPIFSIAGDRQLDTYEQLVAAYIAEAEDQHAAAATLYRSVVDSSTTSSLRSGVIATIRLSRLDRKARSLSSYASLAAREVREASWITAALRDLSQSTTLMSLTKLQREYLDLVCRGYTNAQIASSRRRSVNTVRNQLSVLFDLFRVRNRAELISTYLQLVEGSASWVTPRRRNTVHSDY